MFQCIKQQSFGEKNKLVVLRLIKMLESLSSYCT